MNHIITDVSDVDWDLLRKQKLTLYLAIQDAKTEDVKDDLTGILHLIDHVQDSAAEQLGDDLVFQTE